MSQRSGCCYEETHPRLHRLCQGTFVYTDGMRGFSEIRECFCRCHRVGVETMRMKTGRALVLDRLRVERLLRAKYEGRSA